jgi:hypothetical protein
MAKKSALCDKGTHRDPPVDVYNQLVQMIKDGKVKGDPGYTPQKGVDFWTDADKAEIQDYIDNQFGDVNAALDGIIAIQNSLIRGGS